MKTTRPEMLTVAAIDRAARANQARADLWAMLPLRERERACGVAGLTKAHAALPLDQFTDREREQMYHGIAVHVGHMELIAQCMSAARGPAMNRGRLH